MLTEHCYHYDVGVEYVILLAILHLIASDSRDIVDDIDGKCIE